MEIHDIPSWVTVGYFTTVFVLALWRGSLGQRLVAGFMWLVVMNFYVRVVPQPGNVAVYLAGLVLCAPWALRGRSYWAVWASAGFVLGLVTSVARRFAPQVDAWAFESAQLAWFYLSATAVLIGAQMHRRSPPAA